MHRGSKKDSDAVVKSANLCVHIWRFSGV